MFDNYRTISKKNCLLLSIRTYRILVSAVEVVPCPRNNHLENQIEPIDAKRPSMPMWVVTYTYAYVVILCQSICND